MFNCFQTSERCTESRFAGNMRKLILSSFLLLAFSLIAIAGGNNKTTDLRGTITDKQGEPLAGVKIYIPSLERDIYTDFNGEFSIDGLPLKKQAIKLSYISFEEKEVRLDLDQLSSSIHLELRSK